MIELQPIIVFHGRHFVRHLGICNPICVKLLQAMSGVIPRNLKKRRIFLIPFSWRLQTRHTHRHTQRHTHRHKHMSIAIGEMQCVAFRLKIVISFKTRFSVSSFACSSFVTEATLYPRCKRKRYRQTTGDRVVSDCNSHQTNFTIHYQAST